MQVVILAGGLAQRLGDVTKTKPKALLEVAGKPFIDWQLPLLARAGYTAVVLCIGHLGEQLVEHVGNGARFGLRVEYSADGPVLLGTGGALRNALPLLEREFLVTYGDSYLPFDYAAPLVDLLRHPQVLGSMSVYKNAGKWDRSNTAIVGAEVTRYEKGALDPSLQYIDYGAIALRRAALLNYAEGSCFGLDELQASLAKSRQLRAYLVEQRFYEIGSASGLAELSAHLQKLRAASQL